VLGRGPGGGGRRGGGGAPPGAAWGARGRGQRQRDRSGSRRHDTRGGEEEEEEEEAQEGGQKRVRNSEIYLEGVGRLGSSLLRSFAPSQIRRKLAGSSQAHLKRRCLACDATQPRARATQPSNATRRPNVLGLGLRRRLVCRRR
jgi:hypothetical protein